MSRRVSPSRTLRSRRSFNFHHSDGLQPHLKLPPYATTAKLDLDLIPPPEHSLTHTHTPTPRHTRRTPSFLSPPALILLSELKNRFEASSSQMKSDQSPGFPQRTQVCKHSDVVCVCVCVLYMCVSVKLIETQRLVPCESPPFSFSATAAILCLSRWRPL